MSWDFPTAPKGIYGERGTALTGVTHVSIAFWYWVTSAYALKYVTAVSNVGAEDEATYRDQYLVQEVDSPAGMQCRNIKPDGTASSLATAAMSTLDTWIPVVCNFTNNGARQVWVGSSAATDGEVTTGAVETVSTLSWMYAGQASGNAGSQFVGRLAELAVWAGDSSSALLDATARTNFLVNNYSPDRINASYLKGYWFRQGQTNKSSNLAAEWDLDQTTVLGTNAPAYNSSHPTINYGAAGRNLLLGVS